VVITTEPDMPRILQEAGFVAGLMHDIGKTYTYDKKGHPTALHKLCNHDAFTLEACAYGLGYLDKHSPEIATVLRHIWTCASPGSRYGHPAAITLARYLRDADGQNSMRDNQRLAFSSRNNKGFGKIGKNTYWLPTICG
jgi:3'-5' exoribonuclease